MFRGLSLAFSCAVVAFLTACAVKPYQPYDGGVGYSEVGTAPNRYEVLYHGPEGMDEATAKGYAIVRAAEIGKSLGKTHFRIAGSRARANVTREAERETDLFPRRPWTGELDNRSEWEWRRDRELEESRRRLTVRETRAPVIRLIVDFTGEPCESCLAVEEKLREAEAKGLLKK